LNGVDAAVKGYSLIGNNYTAGVAGYNFMDNPESAGVIGAGKNGITRGMLGYKDASEKLWAGYFKGDGYFSGDVGIGMTSPNEKLTIEGALSLDEISAPSATGGYGKVYVKSADSRLYFKDGLGTEYDLLTASGVDSDWTISGSDMYTGAGVTGNVGIGTTNPLSKLSIGGDGEADTGVYGSGSNTGVYGSGGTGYGVYGKGFYGVGGEDSDTGSYGTLGYNTHGVHGYGFGIIAKGNGNGLGVGVFGEGNHIGVWGEGSNYDFYAAGSGTNYGPFTGAHEVKLSDDFPKDIEPGLIVSVTGQTQVRYDEDSSVTISSTLPTVKLSEVANDKGVFGVLVAGAALGEDHWYQATETERFATVNALGEGRVWVSNINGNIEAGDYISTSTIPGYGQIQADDLLHSYTLGKAIETVDWDTVSETVEYNGQVYKRYLIAVVYTSG
jgi:hypothetical protein